MKLPRLLLLLSLAFTAAEARAAVVIVPRGDFFQFPPGGGNSMNLDIDGNGTIDFEIAGGTGSGGGGGFGLAVNATGVQSTILGLPPAFEADKGSWGYPVSFGTLLAVDQPPFSTYGAGWYQDDVVTVEIPGQPPVEFRAGSVLWATVGTGTVEDPVLTSGYWTPGTRAALAIRFRGSDGELHDGWLDLTVTSPYSLLLHGWAYESEPGKQVTPHAIPEPAGPVWSALVLAGTCLRRRKRA